MKVKIDTTSLGLLQFFSILYGGAITLIPSVLWVVILIVGVSITNAVVWGSLKEVKDD